MKKFRTKFAVVMSVLALSFISCTVDSSRSVSFDKETFSNEKNVWKSQNLQNYSFEYKFKGKYGTYNKYRGIVTVKDGVGTVDFRCNEDYSHNDTIPEQDSLYYITCIEDIFDNIEKVNNNAQKLIDKKEYDYIQIDVTYDELYHYPKYTEDACVNYKDNRGGAVGSYLPSYFVLRITDFKKSE